jgi:hypothetical protein
VLSKNWKAKKAARHIQIAKNAKRDRDIAKWLQKSKTPSDRSPGA